MKIQKLLILTSALVIIHVLFSFLYIPISGVLEMNEKMDFYEKFNYAFYTFYFTLLIPYLIGCYIIMRKNNKQR